MIAHHNSEPHYTSRHQASSSRHSNSSTTLSNPACAPISKLFREIIASSPDLSIPVAVIKALTESLKSSQAQTMTEFTLELEALSRSLQRDTHNAISIAAGCELLTRFVTRLASDERSFDEFKSSLIARCTLFVEKSHLCREKIAEVGLQFLQDGSNILIHSCSKVVMLLLLKAAALNRRFNVYVTEARPACQGIKASKMLSAAGIPCTIVLDAAVGYYIERMDMILVGAEGVVENGGLINQIGTYQMSVMAKSAGKPFYALAESYKFVRLFPLNQYDLPSVYSSSSELLSSIILASSKGTDTPASASASASVSASDAESNMETVTDGKINDPLSMTTPLVDYTPPSFITLLFTDLGVLTPSGVSDELIKFYY